MTEIPQPSAELPLTHTMPNGATIADWLGTAGVAAHIAATRIKQVREGALLPMSSLAALTEAENSLLQALEEVRAIKIHAR